MRRTAALICGFFLLSCSHLELGRSLRNTPADWPTDGRDPSRSNMTAETIRPPLTLRWSNDMTGGIGSGSPVIVDSMLVIGTLRGELYVFDIITGKRKGWISLGEAIQGSPVVDGSTAYVAVSNTRESVLAYDLKEGKLLWSKPFGDIEGSPLLEGGRLFVGNLRGEAYAIEPEKGTELWTFSVSDNHRLKGFRASPAAGDSTVIFGCDDGSVYALGAASGRLLWRAATGHPVTATPLVAGDRVFVGTQGGSFICLDMQTGAERWRRELGSPVFAGAAKLDTMVLAATARGMLFALGRGDGNVVWTSDLGGVVNASPVTAGSVVYVGTLRRILYAVDGRNGAILYQRVLEGRVKTGPAVAFGNLFIATDDRLILAFSGEAGP